MGRLNVNIEEPASLVAFSSINNPDIKWRYLSSVEQLFFIFNYAEINSGYIAMTVDLSSEFIESLKSERDKYDFIRRRLNANFKNVLGYQPDYLFFLESKPQYHLHGIINSPSKDTNKIKNILKLTLFGKRYKSSPMNKYIVSFKPLYHSLGWLGYCLKFRKVSNFKTRYYANDELKKSQKATPCPEIAFR